MNIVLSRRVDQQLTLHENCTKQKGWSTINTSWILYFVGGLINNEHFMNILLSMRVDKKITLHEYCTKQEGWSTINTS